MIFLASAGGYLFAFVVGLAFGLGATGAIWLYRKSIGAAVDKVTKQ